MDDCSAAGKSSDARDKYFLSHVGDYDPFPAKSLRSELPSLEAARSSLAAAATALADVLPQLDFCQAVSLEHTAEERANVPASAVRQAVSAFGARAKYAAGVMAQLVDEENGVDVAGLDLLLFEARASILAVRRALA